MKKLTILLLFPLISHSQPIGNYITTHTGKNPIYIDSIYFGSDDSKKAGLVIGDNSYLSSVSISHWGGFAVGVIAAADSLYLSTEKPSSTHEDIPTTLGMEFKPSSSGNITALKFYKIDASAGSYTVTLWAMDGSKPFQSTVSVSGIGWKRIPCNVPIAEGQSMIVSVYSTLNRYGYTSNAFTSARIRGQLSGYSGRFNRGAPGFPSSVSTTWYGLDVVFESAPPVPLTVKTSPDRDATMPKDSVQISATATGYKSFHWAVEDFQGRFELKDTNTLHPYVVPLDSAGCRVWLFCTVTDATGNQQADAVAIRIAPHPKLVMGYYMIDGTFVWRVPPVFVEFPMPATYVKP